MRICLATTYYPPEHTGGIPRQRQILANALVKQGHEVHVITQGKRHDTIVQNRVVIHTVPFVPQALTFSEKYPALNYRLTHSLAIEEQVRVLNRDRRLDVLDAPLWGLDGFVSSYADQLPVVLWLQTSFAQLSAMGQLAARDDDVGVIALEKESLTRARGIIADSRTVLADFEQLYQLPDLQERARVVHLGLPDLPVPSARPQRGPQDAVEALLVGRLEKRKGTPLIFDLLPDLLAVDRRLRIRFIGSDNSPWDGFYRQHGQTYPQYFHQHWPGLRGRVIFEGQVSDRRLLEAYQQADLLLAPSLYESFGLIYLEAMRAGLPVVTFALGAAPEIFARGEADGALLVDPQEDNALVNAVQTLLQDPHQRAEVGAAGRQRFVSAFLDSHMAAQTADYYQAVAHAADQPGTATRPRRIFQVMEALDVGDAVSTIALNNAALLRDLGAGGTVLSLYHHPALAQRFRPIDRFDSEAHTALIFHYWNYSHLADFARTFGGPKAIHFHNMTPPAFFSPDSPGYEATARGYAQLPDLLNQFDLLIGDSTYNLQVCQPLLTAPKPALVLPPLIDAQEVLDRPYDAPLLERLQAMPGAKLLFVGRIARNKRQDRLIALWSALAEAGGPLPWLFLVGNDQGDPAYRAELESLRTRLAHPERVLFTGKVSDAALYSYYRAADLFVSASEHEGFGVPIIEAMAFDRPVLAYAAAAVPETMGGSGVLLNEWGAQAVAAQAQRLLSDTSWRAQVLAGQRENLRRFTAGEVQKRLLAVVKYLRTAAVDNAFIFDAAPILNQ